MTVCIFGNYIADYPRIQVIKKSLLENDVKVIECQTREIGMAKFFNLYRSHKKIKNDYDVMLVGMGGYTIVWLAKLLTRKRVVFDAFVSQYLTNIEDRKKASAGSIKALYYALLDKYSCAIADMVLLDTQAQIDYFVEKYNLPRKKFVRLFVSCNNDVFKPVLPKKSETSGVLKVHWHGHIVPFHGLEVVVRAAALLREHNDIKFNITTRFDSKYEKYKALADTLGLNNVTFLPESSYAGLAQAINDADICLGVFAETKKASLVIPNKIFEAIACAKPVITSRQKVLYELFTDGITIVLCEPNNYNDLAEKILQIKSNTHLMKAVGEQAYNLYNTVLTPKILGAEFSRALRNLLSS